MWSLLLFHGGHDTTFLVPEFSLSVLDPPLNISFLPGRDFEVHIWRELKSSKTLSRKQVVWVRHSRRWLKKATQLPHPGFGAREEKPEKALTFQWDRFVELPLYFIYLLMSSLVSSTTLKNYNWLNLTNSAVHEYQGDFFPFYLTCRKPTSMRFYSCLKPGDFPSIFLFFFKPWYKSETKSDESQLNWACSSTVAW